MMKHNQENYPALLFALVLIVLAAVSRFIPHPFNFTAIGAMALFSGTAISDRRLAYLFPLVVMLITDVVIGLHVSMLPVYACLAFTVFLGTKIKNRNPLAIGSMSLLASLVFFLITNLPHWYVDIQLYPITLSGTFQSYQMALPFFKNQVLGDLFYNLIIFGSYHFYLKWMPATSAKEVNR